MTGPWFRVVPFALGSSELAKMREPLADLNPSYWALEYGFRN